MYKLIINRLRFPKYNVYNNNDNHKKVLKLGYKSIEPSINYHH